MQRPLAVRLRPGQAQRFTLPLAQRDCAFGRFQGPGRGLQVRVLDPSGKRTMRRFASRAAGPLELDVCVELAGRYQVVVSAEEPGDFTLELQQVLGRPSSPPPRAAGPALTSPRLSALARELADPARAKQALKRFWREVEQHGTPLLEPADVDNLLVTFLYRANPQTRGVSVSWPMYMGQFQQNAMAALPGSDVFWKSIKLPRATRFSYQLVIDAPRDPSPGRELGERPERAVSRSDPRNPRLLTPDPALDAFSQRSLLELPDAPKERWSSGPLAPRGRLEHTLIASEVLGNVHPLSVYLPRGYDPKSPYPLLIFFDGEQYVDELRTPEMLDRLVAARAITPLVAVFVRNASPHSRDEELPCNPRFARFVIEELLPQLWGRYSLSRDPRQVGLAGSSFGGLAASYIALEHPAFFGKVLSQSGSYWWSFPSGDPSYDGSAAPGWLRRRYQQRPRAALELYLSAGTFESGAAHGGVLEHNRLQRDALRALGYSVAYQELIAGHDPLAWRAALPDGLIALFGMAAGPK